MGHLPVPPTVDGCGIPGTVGNQGAGSEALHEQRQDVDFVVGSVLSARSVRVTGSGALCISHPGPP